MSKPPDSSGDPPSDDPPDNDPACEDEDEAGNEDGRRWQLLGPDEMARGAERYVLREKLGEGGEADVYVAFERDVDRPPVALKVLKRAHRNSPEVVRHFIESAERLARLDHPNIIRVRELGRPDDNPPYVALQLVTGGSLAEHQENFRNPREVAELMLKVARAVQYAHERGVLHGDISPANILIEGRSPLLTDFVGKRLGHAPSGIQAGKFNYMSPEKANGQGDTVGADTFSMGAVLYELLSGVPPIRANCAAEVAELCAATPLAAIESFRGRRGVESETLLPALEAVCRTALDANVARRYASAIAFADNLERVLRGLPTLHPPVPFLGRIRLWVVRHPLMSLVACVGAVALVVSDFCVAISALEAKQTQESNVLESNKVIAQLQAQAMLGAARDFEAHTRDAARDPEIVAFLKAPDGAPPAAALETQLGRSRLDTIAVFDLEGTLLARSPHPGRRLIRAPFPFRDYHRCVLELLASPEQLAQSSACISPVYKGESSKRMEFSWASPVLDDSTPVGYVIQSYHARRTLDVQETHNRHTGRVIAMFGHRGVDRNDDKLEASEKLSKYGRLTAAAHPELFGSSEHTMDATLSRRLLGAFQVGQAGAHFEELDAEPQAEAHYVDPVTEVDSLGAFAPVGATGYVIAVSTPRSLGLASWENHWRYLILSLGMLNAGLIGLGVAALMATSRGRLPPRS